VCPLHLDSQSSVSRFQEKCCSAQPPPKRPASESATYNDAEPKSSRAKTACATPARYKEKFLTARIRFGMTILATLMDAVAKRTSGSPLRSQASDD
jgi:hypothetical protein